MIIKLLKIIYFMMLRKRRTSYDYEKHNFEEYNYCE